MVIEKIYKDFAQLHSIITEALPNWMTASDSTISIGDRPFKYYYVGNNDKKACILVYPDEMSCLAKVAAITTWVINSETNLNATTGNQFGYSDSGGDTSNTSYDREKGLVRIISTDHAFGIVLMNSDRIIMTGAAVAYKGALTDNQFWAFIGNDYGGSSSISGPTTLIAQGMLDTVRTLRSISNYYVNDYVLVPYCDWQHGFTDPVDDVYISYTRGSSGMPEILKDSEGNTYYRITSYYRSNYPTIFIKIKAE